MSELPLRPCMIFLADCHFKKLLVFGGQSPKFFYCFLISLFTNLSSWQSELYIFASMASSYHLLKKLYLLFVAECQICISHFSSAVRKTENQDVFISISVKCFPFSARLGKFPEFWKCLFPFHCFSHSIFGSPLSQCSLALMIRMTNSQISILQKKNQ